MTACVALFRGINVGGRNTVPMAELRKLLGELGLSDVRTYIQSGNAVFSASGETDDVGARIRKAVGRRFGFEPQVLVLTAKDFRDIAEANPYAASGSDPRHIHVSFLAERPETPGVDALQAAKAPSEFFELGDKAFYLLAPDGIGRSKLAATLERALGVPCTGRNWRTVTKLLEWL